ncbi:Na-translocating system protein MpsC family protein [Bacillus sp. CECT 9360]|uniref:Na-translocating system protein MpsC family protein n=1 Tax=Bacillus sp. CECT 9360 TaxID=2845821 RepID=UPI001E2FFF23|nr:Na-translocating system protein MpsC family protein [Bacillus sp. CECT 9360]CAH0343942.1 hypothetical protein BCI9360_00169 [Bacillus sp. CECT 9360]
MNVWEKDREKELGSYIGRLLRENFGRGPESVFASINKPFITVYITNFLSPMEKALVNQEQSIYVEKTRDMLMETLIEEIKAYIKIHIGMDIEEFYYDWNLDSPSGMFVAISAKNNQSIIDSYENQDEIHNEIAIVSKEAEKQPDTIYSYFINSRTLLIIRTGFLVNIEKELIKLGFQDTLRVTKRNLEKRLIHEHRHNFEAYLDAQLTDFFVDWDFERDRSSIIFILKPNKNIGR